MSSFGITVFSPQVVHDIEQGYRISFEQEIAQAPTWPSRIMAGIPMRGTTETAWFPEQTIEIEKREKSGGDIIYKTLSWKNRKYTADPYGVGLYIPRYQEVDLREFAGIDAGMSFGEQCGIKAANFPARGVKYLLQNGSDATKVDTWDGEALFSTNHKITSGSPYRFCNTFMGMALTAKNLAAAVAYIGGVQDGTGDHLGLHRRLILVTGLTKKARSDQLLGTEWFTDLFNTAQGAAAQNGFLKTSWGFDEPIADAYFDFAPTKWWLFSNTWRTPDKAPLHMPELEPFNLNSYLSVSNFELAQKEALAYHFKGRVAFQGGEPHRVYQFDSAGVQSNAEMAAILAAM